MNRDNQNKKGFTLVELLVVIGIIAMLISILLPVLARARYQAKLIACASNVRQFSNVLLMYASQSKGQVPLGYFNGKHSQNTELSTGVDYLGKPVPSWLGQSLIDSGYLNDAMVKALYCPLESQQRMMYNGTSANPWPLKAGGYYTFTSYGVRPLINTWYVSGPTLYINCNRGTVNPDSFGYWLYNGSTRRQYFGYPKLTNMKPWMAMVADSTFPTNSNEKPFAHIDKGLNVGYVDGSVQWVPNKAYNANYVLLNTTTNSYNADQYIYSVYGNTGIWPDLDSYHR
jgi:prepilin-type N-terminal cleavage/methylation domain-containing protein/prepilin-type processing-associated H-X9-DG protein